MISPVKFWGILFLGAASAAQAGEPGGAHDPLKLCNAVQNKAALIRYPLGTIGAWSTETGESADVLTRVPLVYPCVNAVARRAARDDWRASLSGDPSFLSIQYRADKPCGSTLASITATPHVTIFQFTFPEHTRSNFLVLDFAKGKVEEWARLSQWTNRMVTRVSERTLQATIGGAGSSNAFYAVRFSAPCAGWGRMDEAGAHEGETAAGGTNPVMYARFEVRTITVAVAESFTSLAKAGEFLETEFTDFDGARKKCRSAWEEVLSRVEFDGPESNRRMAYTALYTMYANIIDGAEGSCYLNYCSRPRSLASSAYWQFIGGFQSCCWDNYRTAYPFLMLGYPEVMSDILDTYLARYKRDGCVDGNICLFTGPTGGHRNIRFSPVLVAEAYESGIRADYPGLYAALKDNFGNEAYLPVNFSRLGYATQPAGGGKACSETLELSTGMAAMALLSAANHDEESTARYLGLAKAYTNVWDGSNRVFRVRNEDGTWGPVDFTNWTWNPNPQGLFEGTTRDWMFSVPHDPFGLMSLPGQGRFVERITDYCLRDTWFNDYQYHYPYLLYYAGAPGIAQEIIRKSWVPLFDKGVMYEGVRPTLPHHPWQTHYTGNAGWLLCSMLGLYPVPTPPGQFIIASPSVTKAVIHHGAHNIVLRARNNNETNLYLRSIRLDGREYPSYMIPAKRLASGAELDLEMGSEPKPGLGPLYIAASDGFIVRAELTSEGGLRFTVEPGVRDALTLVHSRSRPAKVFINGQEASHWGYNAERQETTLRSAGKAEIEVRL